MAVTELVGAFAIRGTALRLFDLGSVEKCGNDSRGSDSDRNASLYQLGPPFFVALFGIAHSNLSLSMSLRPYAERWLLERAVLCAAG